MPSEKPLPVRQLILICAVRFAEPISFSIHAPFIYFMVRDFKICPETEIGYYVGMIASAFSISQLISSLPIGMLSDRIGRRPVVFSGLATTIVGIISFGLSKSFAWALCTKIVMGLLDNNIAVLKSMVSEVTSQHSETQRARAFSLLQVVFGLGGIVGASLGGYLSDPVHKYPSIFGKGGPITEFLTEYPYFLPCFTAAVIASIGWIAGFLFLEESLVRTKEIKATEEDRMVNETQPLVENVNETGSYETFNGSNQSAAKSSINGAVLAVCFTYALIAYQMVFYDELFPIWSASEWSVGGLGLASKEIGTVVSFAGFVTLFIQFFIYHHLTAWLGTLRLLRVTLFICIFVFALQGFNRYLATESNALLWAGLLLNMGLKTIAQTVTITASIILVNNAATHRDALGSINALSQCCSSGMRALGPISSGTVWSLVISATWIPLSLRSQLSWLVLACVAVFTFIASMMLKSKHYIRN